MIVLEDIYLATSDSSNLQIRLRKRSEKGSDSNHLTMTVRHPEINGQRVETRRNLSKREYETSMAQIDESRHPIQKIRNSFLWKDRYYQIDSFQHPHIGLVLLETYLDYDGTNGSGFEDLSDLLPEWLDLEEVTDDKSYSMHNLALNSK